LSFSDRDLDSLFDDGYCGLYSLLCFNERGIDSLFDGSYCLLNDEFSIS
jgi:hypothetical protein